MENNGNQVSKILLRLGGLFLGALIIDSLFGDDKDTVNYTLTHRKRIVYHGITYSDRVETRMLEHTNSGKKFDDYIVSRPRLREQANTIERKRIARDRPKYNVHHNY